MLDDDLLMCKRVRDELKCKSRAPQFHIVLMGLLMVDDELLRCKKRRDKLKRKEDNALKAVHLNPFRVTHLSNVVCLVIGGVGVPSPRGSHTSI